MSDVQFLYRSPEAQRRRRQAIVENRRKFNSLLHSTNDMLRTTPDVTEQFRMKQPKKISQSYTMFDNRKSAQSSRSAMLHKRSNVILPNTDLNTSQISFANVHVVKKPIETGSAVTRPPTIENINKNALADSRSGVRVRRVSKMLNLEENSKNENIQTTISDEQKPRSSSMSSMNASRVSVTKVRRKSTTKIITINSSQHRARGEQKSGETPPNLQNVADPINTSNAIENLIDVNSSINFPSQKTSASSVKVIKIKRPSGTVLPANGNPRPISLPVNNQNSSSTGITVTKIQRAKT
ncbi:unnamed protein product [Rotaria sp. Silwood2]|nr:unnamed protein product [Rotaria sp. Silwood2]CAF4347899.1 unnamed protein product [Rotaria sp. Silwood2]